MLLCLKVPREYDIVLISEKLGYAVSKGCPLELLPHCGDIKKNHLAYCQVVLFLLWINYRGKYNLLLMK